jgi:hypothetical protein|tara:strand:- start:1364 stop:2320 length:957 start_codon:yes stop_codon:yes gene_type:complete
MKKIPKIVKEIQNYVPKAINYAVEKNISFSQLSMYDGCAHRWALQYRDGHKIYTPSMHAVFGKALHEALQHYLDIMYKESGAAADRIDILDFFKTSLKENYLSDYEKNKSIHFFKDGELQEFYQDGENIINYFKKHKGKTFSKRGTYLVGCEIPIIINPNKMFNKVKFQGYLDIVMYNETLNRFTIYDIKTSTNGWGKWALSNKNAIKHYQLVLYKKFFAEQFGIPEKNIDIEFFIVRRKVYEDGDYPQKRIQKFIPSHGKTTINKATNVLNDFIKDVFIGNEYNQKAYKPSLANPNNCRFCPYHGSDLCPGTKNRSL